MSLMKFVLSIVPLLFLSASITPAGGPRPAKIKAHAPTARATNAAEPYDWGVIYYMSYDNDLERFGKGIIEAIGSGVKSPRTIAAVQADFTDDGGMRRYTIKSSGMSEERVASDDSADEGQLIAYLDWFVTRHPSKRYVVILLDHGGGVDEMCFDKRPDTEGKHWMSGRVLGERLRRFKTRVAGEWSLLFLQQCGRGSLENLYSFRGTADFIMSSPVKVGAPNTYYTALHQWLGLNPGAAGDKVAAKISAEDRHYAIYTCLRTAMLPELPKRLDAAIEPLLRAKSLVVPSDPREIYSSGGEASFDARQQLEQLAVANRIEATSLLPFFEWARESLLTNVWFRDGRENPEYSGLSLFRPKAEAEALRRGNLELYRESKLGMLWGMAVGPGNRDDSEPNPRVKTGEVILPVENNRTATEKCRTNSKHNSLNARL